MTININQGPERVQVNAVPVGPVLVPGASTARTAMVLATTKADAPVNTPSLVRSPSEFEALFGDESQVGEAYLSMRGFYENSGEGAELIVVAVSPSGLSGEVLESAESEAPRGITGSLGQLLDDGVILEDSAIVSYDATTGLLTVDNSGATGEASRIKKGDFVADAAGRLFQISQVKSATQFVISAGLDRDLQKTAKSLSPDASNVSFVRLFADSSLAGKMFVQEGAVYASSVTVAVSAQLLTLSGFDAYLNDVRAGDIIVDSAAEEFVVIEVIDGDNLLVDREGLSAGAVDIKRGLKAKSIASGKDSGAEFLALGVAPYEAADGKAKFLLASSASNPPEDSLAGYFIEFDDDSKYKIKGNKIVAESTIVSGPFAGTISYSAATGILTATGETLQTDGVVAGDVLVDSAGREYVVQSVPTEITLQLKKNLASPSSLAGAKVHRGAVELDLGADISAKVEGEAGEDTTGSIRKPANLYTFSSEDSLLSDDFFVIEPAVQSVDYIGSAADLTGLRALDSVDIVNLIAIPGIYDPAVQGSLIDYCSVTRSDCMALVSIPEFVTTSSVDKIVASNLSIASVQEAVTGSIVTFSASPDLSKVSTYDILRIGSAELIVKAVSDQDSKIVVFETAGIPTVGAVSVASPSAVSWKDKIINKPTTKAAWYFNHLAVTDSAGATAIVDPVGHVAGVMARIDSNVSQGGVSHAPAGINLAQLAGTTGLQLDLSERLDGGPLRLAFINRITSSQGNGRYIFGGYTAAGSSATADEQLIQVIRSVLFVKSSLESGLVGFLWENNSPVTRQNISNAILSFLRANAYLFPAGLPEAQQFKVIAVTPDDLALAQGLVQVRVQVRFNTAIRFIDIDLEFPLPVSDQ